jgi:putative nucleotidyltransferase with HDIG domain
MQGVRRQLPFVIVCTLAIVVAPALLVTLLPGGAVVAIAGCTALSLGLSRAGAALWRRLPQSRDLVFADLLPWGFVRRVRTERRIEQVKSMVVANPGDPVEALKDVGALRQVTTMLEARDAYTRRHSLRVTRHCEGIARELGLPEDEIARICTAATLHDLGKFFTPREILNKPGRLTDEEFAVVKRHPADGAAMLHGVVEPEVIAMIRHHHERLSGSGYPDGLAGDAIPLGARIIAVADTFDAMTSTRAYRTARPHAQALGVLRAEAGVALDAQVVDAFATYYRGRGSWAGVAGGLPHAVAPLRELLGAGARTLPVVGASTAIVVGGGGAVAASQVPSVHSSMKEKSVKVAAATKIRTGATTTAATTDRTSRGARQEHKAALSPHKVLTPATGRGKPGRPDPTAHQPNGSHPAAPGASATPAPAQSSPEQPSAATTAPSAPPAATPAPTEAPEVSVPSVTVEVGPVHVETPPVEVDLPDLPPLPLP